jgi:hypothetical protein
LPSQKPIKKPVAEYPIQKQKKFIIIITIVTTIAVVALALLSFLNSNFTDDNYHFETMNIEYVSMAYEQDPISGDVTLHITYSNIGETTITRTLKVIIFEPSGIDYRNSMKITMAPGETTTYDITVDTPAGTEVTNDMIWPHVG